MLSQSVRHFVYSQFAETGTPPELTDITTHLNISIEEAQTALVELAENRHLVLNEKSEILMAHPFSAVQLGFSVMGEKTLWWGGCSWDSFALPNLVNQEVVIATTCPNCNCAHAWRVNPDTAPLGDQIAHFLVPTNQMWADVVFTCGNQRIFCNEDCLDEWLVKTNNLKGYVMNLSTLWKLSSNWYEGRLDFNYQRRDPSTAVQYFREVGLSGAFWGL